MSDWLAIHRGSAPLVVAMPHTGTDLPADIAPLFTSEWDARRDADWWIDHLYDFAREMGASIVRTAISRSVIDVNRDPSGVSLYPGMATTSLCPVDNFDGAPLYIDGGPDDAEIARRRDIYFTPYHTALNAELERLRAEHGRVVLYDAHSIRSRIPRLFDGELPQFNIGTNDGATCAPELAQAVEAICAAHDSTVLNGRFKGGWTTRHYGEPDRGIHAIQMELSMRGYLREPDGLPTTGNWPVPYDPTFAAPMIATLRDVLGACLTFAQGAKK